MKILREDAGASSIRLHLHLRATFAAERSHERAIRRGPLAPIEHRLFSMSFLHL
jgi:hypothetical protein